MPEKKIKKFKSDTASRLKFLRESQPIDGKTSKRHLEKVMQERYKRGSVQSIIGWESGKNIPSTDALQMYSEIYGCTTDFLYGYSNDPKETRKEYQTRMLEERVNQKDATYQQAAEWMVSGNTCFMDYQNTYGDFQITEAETCYRIEWEEKDKTRNLNFSITDFEQFRYYLQKMALSYLNELYMSKQDSFIRETSLFDERNKRFVKKAETALLAAAFQKEGEQ